MRKIITLIIAFTLLSCNKDSESAEPNIKPLIYIQSVYKTSNNLNKEYPDVNSKVYIYYNINSEKFISYKYEGNGKYILGNNIIIPDQIDTINNLGYATIVPKYINKSIYIRIESCYYHPRTSFHEFLPIEKFMDIRLKQINDPE